MWLWIKRWRDWAMNDLWPLYRISPQPQALHYSYEKAGLTLHDQPIPWNAEAVLVEAMLRLPPGAGRRKGDFSLRLPGQPPVPADQLRRQDGDERYGILFRLPPPTATTAAEILYRTHVLGQLTLPFLSREEFLRNLRLHLPTLFVRIGAENVACQTFVASQCRGLLANAVLISPTSLVPILDLELQVEFRCERGGTFHRTPVRLCSSQLAGRQALVAVMPRRHPRRIGPGRRPGCSATGRWRRSASGPSPSGIFIGRCACPTPALSSRTAPARCGWRGRRRRRTVRRGWGRAFWSAAPSRGWPASARSGWPPRSPARCPRRRCWNRKCSSPTARR